MSRPMALAALRPLARSRPVVLPSSAALVVRFASTSTSTSSPPPPSPSSSSASPGPAHSTGSLPLSWPQYLSLRRQRRLWSTLTSVPTTFAGLFLGGGYFASLEADPSQLIMGIEPMFVYGGAPLGCMLLGYLLGPTLGASLFSLTHRSIFRGNPAPFEVMDRAFFEHIKRNRVSPVFQSVNNPSPDYYGEKIVSLSTYRRWLRDQAAYKRKAMHGVPDEQL
ncbi:TIM23 complex component [Saitozyma podzolica]|uniref:Presequence translocated-associated motor subunit PAM17 n=1 Tax=Saitozyma podzolica TaxID=1890683 RepID=A0A427YQ44_9TREE|nr:TIM23 complex component [Saitozyma podzolica]